MLKSVTSRIKELSSVIATKDDIKHIVHDIPQIKPERRLNDGQKDTSKPEYMRNYMKDYREKGKDDSKYVKVPDKIKELRKKQKDRLKKKFNLKNSDLISLSDFIRASNDFS